LTAIKRELLEESGFEIPKENAGYIYNIGDISQAIRNMKINEVLSNETET
jgi:hypothetical protein